MTETEWLTSTDPEAMLAGIIGTGTPLWHAVEAITPGDVPKIRPSDRKLRLFACACCRAVWDRLADPRSRRAVLVAERYADGEATDQVAAWAEVAANLAARSVVGGADRGALRFPAWACATRTGGMFEFNFGHYLQRLARHVPPATQAALLRCLVGNPWRPVKPCDCRSDITPVGWHTPACTLDSWLRWNDATVPRIARVIYDGRRWDDLPVLADALEDAGCTDAAILGHLRGPGPHARGCWCVDLILGKE